MYWVHVFCSWLLSFVPASLAYAIVDVFAPIFSLFWVGQYRRALANMERVLGPRPHPPEVRRLVRKVFRNYARYMVDLLVLPKRSPAEVQRRFKAYGLEHIDSSLHRGKGVVLVTAHIGNWDAAGAFLAGRGY